MKAYVLFHETNDIVRLVKTKVRDGMIEIGDKTFDVDEFSAKLLKTWNGVYPLYMLKWDCVNPAVNFNKPIKAEEFKPEFKRDKYINPEILQKTMNLRILGNLLKVRKPVSSWIPLILGLIFGAFLMYFLMISGLFR